MRKLLRDATRTHSVPPKALNRILDAIFSLETPLGAWFPFPWGTSVLGVFQKDIVPAQ